MILLRMEVFSLNGHPMVTIGCLNFSQGVNSIGGWFDL